MSAGQREENHTSGKTHDLTEVFSIKEQSRELILQLAEIAVGPGEERRGRGAGKVRGRDRSRRAEQENEEKEEDGEGTVNVAH